MLKLRKIGIRDYAVLEGGQRIGQSASPLPLCGRAAFFANRHEFEQVTGYRHAVSAPVLHIDEANSREGKQRRYEPAQFFK